MALRKKPQKINKRSGFSASSAIGVCGLLAAAIMYAQQQRPAAATTSPTPVQVVSHEESVLLPVPVRAVARGERVSNVPVTMVSWPKSKLSGEFIRNTALYKDRIIASALPARLPIPVHAVQDSHTDLNAVVENIPPGMRAITVRVNEESAVEGWARSGSHVDVILIKKGSADELQSRIIAENVRILSAGRSVEPGTTGTSAPKAPKTVTLLVSQEDALRIKTASSIGKLTFSLRGSGDIDPAQVHQVRQQHLLGGSVTTKAFDYQGTAKGPDGRVYYLVDNRRWVPKAAPQHENGAS